MDKRIEALAMKLILAKDKCKARKTCDGCNYSNINDADLCEALFMAEELLKYYKPIDEVFSREEVDEISEMAINNSHKKTVDKFAERLKEKFAYDIERCKAVDEIAKEIKEGK